MQSFRISHSTGVRWKGLMLMLLLLSPQLLFVQTALKGRVSDTVTGESMPGVNIYIPELQKGTITNDEGA